MEKTEPRIAIIYDTKTGHTFSMAKIIEDAIVAMGVSCGTYLARPYMQIDWTNIRGIALGSPTINHSISVNMKLALPQIPKNIIENSVAGAFGSYAWSGEAPELLNEFLENNNARIVAGPLGIIQAPGPSDKKRCHKFGQRLAESLKLLVTPWSH
ncbi:MAG: flavodoxin domain-containing protein [Candidatus Ranarchaeia archaeon]